MARQKAQLEVNQHVVGLITEAGRLNFPPNASVYEKNFVLHPSGKRGRRMGLELLGSIVPAPVRDGDGDVIEGNIPGGWKPVDPGPEPGDWEGGLDTRPGAPGWYKFDTVPVEMGGLFSPHDISVTSTLSPEYNVGLLKNNAQAYVDMLGWDGAYSAILNGITNVYTVMNPNIVRAYSTLPHPTNFLSGQADEGAASSWSVYSDLTPGTTLYVYGVDQEQHYIKVEDPSQGYVPAPVEFDTFQKSIAFSFNECSGPSCPESYIMLWSLEKVVEVNFPAIMEWIMPPRGS